MNKIITLRTEKIHRYGKSVKIAGIPVKFDKFGLADVTERHVEDLLKGGLKVVDEVDFDANSRGQDRECEVPVVDLHDENAKLKLENDKLKKENEVLKTDMTQFHLKKGVDTEAEEVEKTEETGENDSVDKMSFKELRELCADPELKFPKGEWKDIKRLTELKAYVKGKL